MSGAAALVDAVLVTGFPYDVHQRVDEIVGLFAAFVGQAQAVRRLGSAAIDLCYVAAGRMDGFWEHVAERGKDQNPYRAGFLQFVAVAEDDAQPAAARQLGGDDEILLAQRQEAAAHLAPERGPADQRQDHGDREIGLLDRPGARQGRGEREPDRDRRDRLQQLDQALDDHVGEAAEIAGDAA